MKRKTKYKVWSQADLDWTSRAILSSLTLDKLCSLFSVVKKGLCNTPYKLMCVCVCVCVCVKVNLPFIMLK
jgi:hypothetical protein